MLRTLKVSGGTLTSSRVGRFLGVGAACPWVEGSVGALPHASVTVGVSSPSSAGRTSLMTGEETEKYRSPRRWNTGMLTLS